MKPEQITASFFQIINNQPELFIGEAKQDLIQLEMAVDRAEYIPEAYQTVFLADAIIDFCDVNPPIYQALLENLKTSQTEEDSQPFTEENRILLSQKIHSLLYQSSEI